MAADIARDEILAHLQARVAQLERRRRFPRRALPLALVGLLVALLPLSILAAGPFGDLNPGRDAANADIQAIANAGITRGCNPPDFTAYCPNDLVTREQMASFLARTAGLGTNPPVVNAKTAQTANLATNAAQLNGQAASFYQPAGQPIANATHATTADNATTVGGYTPNGLVRIATGSTLSLSSGQAVSSLQTAQLTAPAAGFVLVTATTNPVTFNGPSCPCQATARIHHITSDTFSTDALASVPNATAVSGTRLALTWVFPVAAGVQTFEILGSTTPVTQYNPTLTLLYVPFGSGGAGTLEVSPAPSSTPPITVP